MVVSIYHIAMDYSYHYVAFICVHSYLPEMRSLLNVHGIGLVFVQVFMCTMQMNMLGYGNGQVEQTVNCERNTSCQNIAHSVCGGRVQRSALT